MNDYLNETQKKTFELSGFLPSNTSFDFLSQEPDLYSVEDIIQVYEVLKD